MNTLRVQHIEQKGETHCGPACLEMVYRYFDINDATQDSIWEEKKTTRPDGTASFMTTSNMAQDLIEKKFQVLLGQLYLDPTQCKNSIKSILAAEIPIIACKQWDHDRTYGHFVVIVGVVGDEIIYLDPDHGPGPQTKSIEKFIGEWEPTGEEVIGGQFIIMSKEPKKLPIKNLQLTSFEAPTLRSFSLDSLNFPASV